MTNNFNNWWKAGILLAGIVALAAIALIEIPPNYSSKAFGSVGLKLAENYDPYIRYNGGYYTALPIETTSTLQVGSAGTAVSNVVNATCSMKADVSIVASTTGYAYCSGVTGVVSSDFVVAQFATSTNSFTLTKDLFFIIASHASTTAGSIDFEVYNGTGANAVPSAVGQMGSTTAIRASH